MYTDMSECLATLEYPITTAKKSFFVASFPVSFMNNHAVYLHVLEIDKITQSIP